MGGVVIVQVELTFRAQVCLAEIEISLVPQRGGRQGTKFPY